MASAACIKQTLWDSHEIPEQVVAVAAVAVVVDKDIVIVCIFCYW